MSRTHQLTTNTRTSSHKLNKIFHTWWERTASNAALDSGGQAFKCFSLRKYFMKKLIIESMAELSVDLVSRMFNVSKVSFGVCWPTFTSPNISTAGPFFYMNQTEIKKHLRNSLYVCIAFSFVMDNSLGLAEFEILIRVVKVHRK